MTYIMEIRFEYEAECRNLILQCWKKITENDWFGIIVSLLLLFICAGLSKLKIFVLFFSLPFPFLLIISSINPRDFYSNMYQNSAQVVLFLGFLEICHINLSYYWSWKFEFHSRIMADLDWTCCWLGY